MSLIQLVRVATDLDRDSRRLLLPVMLNRNEPRTAAISHRPPKALRPTSAIPEPFVTGFTIAGCHRSSRIPRDRAATAEFLAPLGAGKRPYDESVALLDQGLKYNTRGAQSLELPPTAIAEGRQNNIGADAR